MYANEIIKEIQRLRSYKGLDEKIIKVMISLSIPLQNLLKDQNDLITSKTNAKEVEFVPEEKIEDKSYEKYKIKEETIGIFITE